MYENFLLNENMSTAFYSNLSRSVDCKMHTQNALFAINFRKIKLYHEVLIYSENNQLIVSGILLFIHTYVHEHVIEKFGSMFD